MPDARILAFLQRFEEIIMKIDLSTLRSLALKPVWDENGNCIELGVCWKDDRAVVVFVRHFG